MKPHLATGIALAFAAPSNAATILALHQFEVANPGVGSTPLAPANPSTLASADLDPNSIASSVTLGAGLAIGTGGNGGGATGASGSPFTSHRTGVHDYEAGQYGGGAPNNFFNASGGQNSASTTANGGLYINKTDVVNSAVNLAANEYIAFGLTATPGNALQLDSLSFFLQETGGNDNALFTAYYSLDGFTTSFVVGTANTAIPESYGSGFNINLTGVTALQNVPDTATASFRIYLADTGTSGGRSMRFDDITIMGTVIPEPSSATLVGLTLAGLLLHRRR